ncbi:hypothetical protein P7C71_g2567, partial [Lecanoromycetidae sp. Uapishka_2]
MADTVTIDKAYFETLLRRDYATPLDISTVTIPKPDHDNLILIRGGSVPLPPIDASLEDGEQTDRGGDLFTRPAKTQIRMSRPADESWADTAPDWPPKSIGNGFGGYNKGKPSFSSRHNSGAQEDDISWDPELDKDSGNLGIPRVERKRYAREEQRTILVKNLSDRTTHLDIVQIARGGLVLDVYLRTNERNASISFVEGGAAQNFMDYVKRNDVYVHGKRLDFVWNDRQFILPGHVANKIGIGATRNLIIKNVHPNITAERLREDLDHIHNLVIVDLSFQNSNAYLSLNSIHNSLFARTCMMSRVTYKGMKIEWYPDECCQPLPKPQQVPRKANLAPPPVKKSTSMMNRFQMLNIDGDDTEEGSEDGEILSELSSMNINRRSPWKTATVAV